jgi:hypothetical protein
MATEASALHDLDIAYRDRGCSVTIAALMLAFVVGQRN